MNRAVYITPSVRRERRIDLAAKTISGIKTRRQKVKNFHELAVKPVCLTLQHYFQPHIIFATIKESVDKLLEHTIVGTFFSCHAFLFL
jgi:hypothetical protein